MYLGNLSKGAIETSQGSETNMSRQGAVRAGKGIVRAGQDF